MTECIVASSELQIKAANKKNLKLLKELDHMQWSKEEAAAARKNVEENSAVRVLLEEQVKYESEASKYWDTFYKIHKNKFFKDRNWLLREFPEILPVDQKTEGKAKELSWDHVKTNAANCFSRMHCPAVPEFKNHYKKSSSSSDDQSKAVSDFSSLNSEEHRRGPLKTELFPGSNATFRILEVGCGAGNSVFPILNTLQNAPESFLYCCDFASGAVELVKSHSSYRAAQCCAFVHDVCDDGSPYPFPDGLLDVILLVFVLSSIHPDRMQGVVNRLSKLLKPGGMLLFRDYGRYDKTQLRFKRGNSIFGLELFSCVLKNALFILHEYKVSLITAIFFLGQCLSENFYVRGDGTRVYFFTKGEIHSMFCKAGLDEKQNLVDRRLQVNRKKQPLCDNVTEYEFIDLHKPERWGTVLGETYPERCRQKETLAKPEDCPHSPL
ncbi:hypothetical protein HPG69_004816 [Diceros bicornis minor]|uniref:tRNA N(3)-cytidine methyltransferase n=1 Tax=Diceros bicornis minor TaxID=77932 RepID=A0A7J7E4R8_DICBM|nr:hypothetical protein HPG69_004816 [Diceros bicornis minor]